MLQSFTVSKIKVSKTKSQSQFHSIVSILTCSESVYHTLYGTVAQHVISIYTKRNIETTYSYTAVNNCPTDTSLFTRQTTKPKR